MQNEPFSSRIEPFRIFFPLGYVLAILGLGLWILDYLEPTGANPGKGHAVVMMQGFAFAFSLGIIMTELGKAFGQNRFPPLIQMIMFPLLLSAMAAAALAREIGLSQMFLFFAALGLVLFLAVSYILKKNAAHPDFIFTAGASLAMLAGSLAWLLGEAQYLPTAYLRWGQLACFQAFFLLFAFATFHWETPQSARLWPEGTSRRLAANSLVVLLLLAAIAAEAFVPVWAPDYGIPTVRAVYALKAGLVLWFLLARVQPSLPPSLGNARLGLFFILFGLSLPILFPVQVVAVSHFTYVAGFGWFVMARATTLVSARHSYRMPLTGWGSLLLYGSLLLVGGSLRAFADFFPEKRAVLLVLAAVFVILPILVWSFLFFPYIGRRDTSEMDYVR